MVDRSQIIASLEEYRLIKDQLEYERAVSQLGHEFTAGQLEQILFNLGGKPAQIAKPVNKYTDQSLNSLQHYWRVFNLDAKQRMQVFEAAADKGKALETPENIRLRLEPSEEAAVGFDGDFEKYAFPTTMHRYDKLCSQISARMPDASLKEIHESAANKLIDINYSRSYLGGSPGRWTAKILEELSEPLQQSFLIINNDDLLATDGLVGAFQSRFILYQALTKKMDPGFLASIQGFKTMNDMISRYSNAGNLTVNITDCIIQGSNLNFGTYSNGKVDIDNSVIQRSEIDASKGKISDTVIQRSRIE